LVQPAAAPAAAAQVENGTLRAPSGLERTVAQRLTAAKQQVPHFYLAVDAEMSAVVALRAQLNASQSRQRLTLNHFVLAAVGQALEAMPEINCVWTDEGILSLSSSDVGMAVSTEKGLLVPVLRGVGRRSLGGIAEQAGELIGRAQAGRLSSADMQGGAITVSNAGMHDVTYMTSIINPGQSMILGVGSIREVFRPDDNGQPVIRREMGMVLSADHRVLDGVTGLKFLKLVVHALSQPMGLLVA
jgi:pyruvate dehydrogenase E2 component (dihydrolipoamide acetyltransferase)